MNHVRWGVLVAVGSLLFAIVFTVVAIAVHLSALIAAIVGGSLVFVVVFVGSIMNGLRARSNLRGGDR
jgi:hypothetical protein